MACTGAENRRTKSRALSAVVGVAVLLLLAGPGRADETARSGRDRRTAYVIVRMLPGVDADPQRVADQVNGRVDRTLPIINGFSAVVPIEQLGALRTLTGLLEATEGTAINVVPREAADT